LRVAPDAVDAVRFERLVGQARNDEDPRRVRLLREAVALWRGAAMQDVGLQDSAAFDAAVTRLEGLRLTAMEDRFDAEISLGHGVELVTELTDLVAAHPVRERLVAALMRALVAAGRDTEALLVYQRTREALADALGVDPSPELSALHVALLRGELGRREENRKTNLRAELTSFVGKDADVAAVRELIAEHRLTTVIGPGGSGRPGWPRKPRARCSATCRTGPGWWNSPPSAPTVTWPRRRWPGSGSGMPCSARHRARIRWTGSSPRSASGKRC
jgi:DNA-binding transcriptional activator of the SARP family